MEYIEKLAECSVDKLIQFLELGKIVYFGDEFSEKHQNIAEEILKSGYGELVQFSDLAKKKFLLNACKKNQPGTVRKIIRNAPEMCEMLKEIAVAEGYISIVRMLYQEKIITTIDDELFEEAIARKNYYSVKFIVENGMHEVRYRDILIAATYGSIKTLHFLVNTDVKRIKSQGEKVNPMRYAQVIEEACRFNRKDSVIALVQKGFKCNFDTAITNASRFGYKKIIKILEQYSAA